MTTKTPKKLVDLADDITQEPKGWSKDFDNGDEQLSLTVYWLPQHGGFEVFATHYTDPHYFSGGYFDPPETVWNEREEHAIHRNIKGVAEWVKNEFSVNI